MNTVNVVLPWSESTPTTQMYTVNVVLPGAESQPNTQINVVLTLPDTTPTNYQCFTCTILIQNYNFLQMFMIIYSILSKKSRMTKLIK